MATFQRSTMVRADLDDVWTFHSTVDGLVELTPNWFNLRVEAVVGPDGEPDPEILAEGSEVRISVRPMGLGPRQAWTSRITRRERSGDRAVFRDEMVEGPFRQWQHTHRFMAAGGGTRVTDRVSYEFPLGPAVSLSFVAWPGFAAMFRYRHRRTRQRLE
ncbi:MAG: SRPBCC family protein [Halobacteriales archaeon]